MSSPAGYTREGGLILPDAPKCNVIGAYIIAGYVFVVLSYLGSCWLSRWRGSRGKMSELDSGKFRLAAATGRVDILAGIKATRGDVFDVDCDVLGFTALHAAVCQGEVGAVLWLLQHGADVEKVKHDGWEYSALHYAACKGNLEMIRILVAYGAQIDRENFLGETAAQIASNMGHRSASKYLTRLGAAFVDDAGLDGGTEARRPSFATGGDDEGGDDEGGDDGDHEGLLCRLRRGYDGCYYEKRVDEGTKLVTWKKKHGRVFRAKDDEFEAYMKRGYEGYGTPGTEPSRYLRGFRRVAEVYLVISFSYLVWRALRALNPGWWYFYSVPFYFAELVGWTLGLCFLYSLYYQIDRPSRSITRMLPEAAYPKVDVFICRYSEPVEVLEATTVAALNVDYPGEKLSVYVLDDGKSDDVRAMCKRLRYQLRYMDRRANIFYVGRGKRKGVPHHAKAGNINNTLLMHSAADTEYILVLDCDMIVHPTFLHRTLSHLYERTEVGEWRRKEFIGLLQTPQDFWNVDSEDPLVHCARFFYGPMLQGRDGAGACPCCGTGVIFQRSALVSVGGQSYGSITEDCNTSMQLLSSGFANMFLNERLVYGMAPEDLPGVFQQRERWAMGALQILYRDNPLRKRGLTVAQSLLFFEIGAHHYLAIGTILTTVVSLVYVYIETSPVVVEYLWEFCIVFVVYFACNRVMIWWAHRGCASGGTLELWRGGQMWIWMSPSHIKAIWRTFVGETNLFRCFGRFELTFKVTSKDAAPSVSAWSSLTFALPFVLYLFAVLGSCIYFVIRAAEKSYSTWALLMTLTAIAWSIYISLCIWPPVSVLIPRVETEQGWKISWDTAIDESKLMVDEKKRVVRRQKDKDQTGANGGVSKGGKRSMALDHGGRSIISHVVQQMEEGADAYDFAGLTKDANNTFRLGQMPDGMIQKYSGERDTDDGEFSSPFVAPEEFQSHSEGERSPSMEPSPSGGGPSGTASLPMRLQTFGSSMISNMSSLFPRGSTYQKASSMNIGRVALPEKTAQGIAGSLYTSMILPEPSKSRFDDSKVSVHTRSNEPSVDADTHKGYDARHNRRDIRHLSIQSLMSQDSIRRSLILVDSAIAEGSNAGRVARNLVELHSQRPRISASGEVTINPFVDTLQRSVLIVDRDTTSLEASPVHVVQTEISSDDRATGVFKLGVDDSNPSFTSPFVDEVPATSVIGPRAHPISATGSTTTDDSSRNPAGKSGHFSLTEDGRVIVSGQEVGIDTLLGQVVNEMKFSSGPLGSLNSQSPMIDLEGGAFLSEISSHQLSSLMGMMGVPPGHGSMVLQKYGESLLRSMSMSYRENLPPDSQRVVDLQRRMIPSSIIMGEGATDTLGKRLMNQPGSIVLSSIFAQLSQMQPSVLQKKGLVLPIIPDDVFEHTIASKPSFEFRVLPEKTVTFFAVNGAILAGVLAGGIVSIFFQGYE